jgi:hypothetical protein
VKRKKTRYICWSTHSNSPTNSPNSVPPRRIHVIAESGLKQLRLTDMWYIGRVSGALEGGMSSIALCDTGEKE